MPNEKARHDLGKAVYDDLGTLHFQNLHRKVNAMPFIQVNYCAYAASVIAQRLHCRTVFRQQQPPSRKCYVTPSM